MARTQSNALAALRTVDDTPYTEQLIAPNRGDGGDHYSGLLIVSDMVPGNETKPLGTKEFADDQSIGKLAVVNPYFYRPGANNVAAFYGNGFGWHDTVSFRNHSHRIRDDLHNHTTDVRLSGRLHTRTPMATPQFIPHDYLETVKRY
jgi:hypothetical protein